MWQLTYAALLSWLKWLEAAPASYPYYGPLATVWVGLYQQPTVPVTPTSTMANITEANYDGYARQEIVWLPEMITQAGQVTKKGQNMQFMPLDTVVPNTIAGAFLVSAPTGGILLAGAVAPVPIPLMGPPAAVFVVPVLQLPSSPIYGAPEWNY